MRPKPLDCPETGEPCVSDDCTVGNCVEKVRAFNRQQAEAAGRVQTLYAKHLKDLTLEDIEAMPDRQGPISN